MKRKYWKGSTRLFSDLSWCLLIALLIQIHKRNTISFWELIGSAMACFFIFFFWSWNKEHLKSNPAKTVVTILTGLYLSIILSFAVISLLNPRLLLSPIGIGLFVNIGVGFLVIKKSLRLFFAKKPLKNEVSK